MDVSIRDDSIISLGRIIVEESGMAQDCDTLGRWMSHYIAELMNQIENFEGREKELLKEKCCECILEFWNHRNSVTRSMKPFADVEKICDALKSLVTKPSLYFQAAEDYPDDENITNLITVQKGAKTLSTHLLGEIKEKVSNDSLEQLESLQELLDEIPENRFIQLLARVADTGKRELGQDISSLRALEEVISSIIQKKEEGLAEMEGAHNEAIGATNA